MKKLIAIVAFLALNPFVFAMSPAEAISCLQRTMEAEFPTSFAGVYPIRIFEMNELNIYSVRLSKEKSMDLISSEENYLVSRYSSKHIHNKMRMYLNGSKPLYYRYYNQSSQDYILEANSVRKTSKGLHFNEFEREITVPYYKIRFARVKEREALKQDEIEGVKDSIVSMLSILRNGAEFAEMLGYEVDLKLLDEIQKDCVSQN